MRTLLATMMALMLLLAGCLDGDDAGGEDEPTEDVPDEGSGEEESTIKDRGEYTIDLESGQCDAKAYEEPAPGQYTSDIGGGTWAFEETNGIPGLQYENNHALAGQGAGFDLPVEEACSNGDQVVA